MRVNAEAVQRVIERHVAEGLDSVCKRLCYDDWDVMPLFRHMARDIDEIAAMTGALALGLDLGIELERERQRRVDPEAPQTKDEFLETGELNC